MKLLHLFRDQPTERCLDREQDDLIVADDDGWRCATTGESLEPAEVVRRILQSAATCVW